MTPVYVDTSVLAKWYLNEVLSAQVESFLQSEGPVHISSLTQLELRCLLARRRRVGDITAEIESTVFSTFEQHVTDGHLILHPVHSTHFDDAVRLISSLVDHPLRSLDGLHLAVIHREGLMRLATADKVMAQAGEGMGLEIEFFAERG